MAFDVAPGAPITGRSFFRDRDRAEVRGEARLTRNRMKSLNHRDTLKKCSEILSRPLSEFLKKVTSSDHKPGATGFKSSSSCANQSRRGCGQGRDGELIDLPGTAPTVDGQRPTIPPDLPSTIQICAGVPTVGRPNDVPPSVPLVVPFNHSTLPPPTRVVGRSSPKSSCAEVLSACQSCEKARRRSVGI